MKILTMILLISTVFAAAYGQHFEPVQGGDFTNAFNVRVFSATIEGNDLGAWDEIAVFDGEYCLAAAVLTGPITTYLPIVVPYNDTVTPQIDGYTIGNPIIIKMYHNDTGDVFSSQNGVVYIEYIDGGPNFEFRGSAEVRLSVDEIPVEPDVLFDSNEGHWINTTASLVGGYPDGNWVYRSIDWDTTEKYWTVQFSTEGYEELAFNYAIRRESDDDFEVYGPRRFTTQYSIDGGMNWVLYENTNPPANPTYVLLPVGEEWLTMSYDLPEECNDKKQVMFKWQLNRTLDVENDGFSEIRNVRVTGTGEAIRDMENIPANDSVPVVFNRTGISIAFSPAVANPYQTITSVLKKHRPAGTPPEGYPNIAPQYWTITSSAANPGTYDITIDITGIPGISVPGELVLLKRSHFDDNGAWSSYGNPNVNGDLLTWTGINDGFSDFTLGGSGVNTLPVELSSFTAAVTANMFVQLKWTAETETYMLGYNVFRSETNNISDAVKANFVIIPAHNSSYARDYTYYDEDVEGGMMYYYWLQSNDLDLTNQFHGPVSVFVEAQHDNDSLIKPELVTELIGAYPNPFNPSTNIAFSVAGDSKVSIKVYNIAGMHIKTIVNNESFTKGKHSVHWDGTDSYGNSAASGVYFYKMETDIEESMIKKMILLK